MGLFLCVFSQNERIFSIFYNNNIIFELYLCLLALYNMRAIAAKMETNRISLYNFEETSPKKNTSLTQVLCCGRKQLEIVKCEMA